MYKFRFLVALIAIVLVAGACTPSSDDATGDEQSVQTAGDDAATDEPTAEPETEATAETTADEEPTAVPDAAEDTADAVELTASFRGVTPETITVGVSMLDFGALAELGLVQAGWGDQQMVWEVFIDDLNNRGGINGRMVEAVYSYYSPLGTEAAETTCIELTEDVESFAVLGGFLGPSETVNPCVTSVHDTIMINGVITRERLAQATAPWVQAAALGDRRLDMFLSLLDSEGMLQDRKIAVVGSVESAEVADEAGPALEALGVTPVRIITNDVVQGDIQAENDAWAVFAERIASDGADTVLAIGSGQAALRGIAAAGLDVEIWILNVADLSNLGSETPKELGDGAITITGLTDQERWEDPLTVECRDIFAAAHPEVELIAPDDILEEEEAWFNPIINYCSWLQIFEMIATRAGPNLTQDSFQAAINGMTDFAIAGVPFASFGPDKPDASDAFRLGIFDANATDTGDVVALTDVLDATP